MARTLFLVRHAMAYPGARSDFDRPLTPGGTEESVALGKRLHKAGILPDLILSSTALRCRQTSEAMAHELGAELSSIRAIDALYNAPVEALLTSLKMLGPHVQKALVVGHNPAISELVVYLSDHTFDFLPPCGCASLSITANGWNRLGRSSARFAWVDTPERPYLDD